MAPGSHNCLPSFKSYLETWGAAVVGVAQVTNKKCLNGERKKNQSFLFVNSKHQQSHRLWVSVTAEILNVSIAGCFSSKSEDRLHTTRLLTPTDPVQLCLSASPAWKPASQHTPAVKAHPAPQRAAFQPCSEGRILRIVCGARGHTMGPSLTQALAFWVLTKPEKMSLANQKVH